MITNKETIEAINRELHRDYRVLDGRPIYRIVWSADLLEKRRGTYTDWYGHILIRQEYQAVREVKKYWYINPPCWVLEKLVFVKGNQALKDITSELVEAHNGSYEPVYSFRDKDEVPLPVSRTVVELILKTLHNPTKKLPSDFEAERLLEEQEEVRYFYEEIQKDARSELFVWENSAFVSSNQLKFKQEYREHASPIEL
jgi:hypothetical protein